ncbi:NUDIX hydrolase [Streptomyces californicus]
MVPCFVDTVEHIADGWSDRGRSTSSSAAWRRWTSRRHGPEVDEPCGEYEIVRVPFSRVGIAAVHLVPLSLRHYLDGNIEGVRAMHAPDLG